jgi:CRP-like cAMP-binding protein
MMHHIEDVLADHPFFAGLSAPKLALIAGCGRNVRLDPGEILAREGDPAETFHAIRHGRVAIRVAAPGHEPITLTTLEDGDIVGWSWLFPPYRWQYDVVAIAPTATIQFDGFCLRGKCEADPVLGHDLMKRFAVLFARRLAETRLQLLDVHAPVIRD